MAGRRRADYRSGQQVPYPPAFCAGDTVPLFPSLNLHYARNYGAAFSFLADSGGWQRWFFAGIAIGISVVLAVLMYRSKASQKLNNIAYAMIIGGALGNLFDRLWHGFVVDMIDFYVGDWHFATFNGRQLHLRRRGADCAGRLPAERGCEETGVTKPAGRRYACPAWVILRPGKRYRHRAKQVSVPACQNLYRVIARCWCTLRSNSKMAPPLSQPATMVNLRCFVWGWFTVRRA